MKHTYNKVYTKSAQKWIDNYRKSSFERIISTEIRVSKTKSPNKAVSDTMTAVDQR